MPKIINEITEEHLKKLDQIDMDCIAAHVPTPPKTFINMQVHDKNGDLVTDYKLPSRSWVRNAYNVLASQFCFINNTTGTSYGAGCMKNKNTSGTEHSTSGYTNRINIINASTAGAASDASTGIVIGTSDSAETFESYILGAQIAQGTSAGQMSYAAGSISNVYNSLVWTTTMSRIINNNSGSEISVKEIGIIGMVATGSSTSYSLDLICRDVLASAVAVPDGGQLTVTYTMQMTFPA